MSTVTKTLIDLEVEGLDRALALSREPTKQAVVRLALEEYVRRREFSLFVDFVDTGALDDLGDPEVIAAAQR